MKFFVIPYILAVDLVVPPRRLDYKPTFFFHVAINSSARILSSPEIVTSYHLEAVMSCTPDPISLWCCFKDTKITHEQQFARYSSTMIFPSDDDISNRVTITKEKFLLEFDHTGVKISSCVEKSERSVRMIQKIVDLLNVDVDFDGERRGSSRLETVTVVDDCPVTTRANFRPLDDSRTRNLSSGFFKLTTHPDEFDETSVWILELNRTRDIERCKNYKNYFFGSGGDDYFHGSKVTSNVTSSINNIKITNDNFISTSRTKGAITARTIKFIAQDTITISIGLDDIYVPA